METRLDELAGRFPPVISGASALEHIRARPPALFDAPSAVLVVDEAVVATGYADRLRTELVAGRDVTVHVVPPREPTSESIEAAAQAVRAADEPVVIGIGGGTALDIAKLAAAVATTTDDVERFALGARRLPTGRPVVAVPTTSGTGSEVTRTCVLTARNGRKVWVWDDELLPRLVVLDPAAAATMPAGITAATGLDAFVHALEAVTGARSGSAVAAPALLAIGLVLEHLPSAVAHGDDLDARQAMQEAATLAGAAIDDGGTGMAHAIGHSLGSLAGVPHGVAVAVGLAAALRWNVDGAADAFEPVAGALGRPVGELPDAYAELLADCRFAESLRRLGPLSVDVEQLAATMVAPENRPMYDNNCRRADDRQRRELAEGTLRTWDDLLGAT